MSENIRKVALHPLEIGLLQWLAKSTDSYSWTGFGALSSSGLTPDQLRRAIEWLKSKDLLETRTNQKIVYTLGDNGKIVERNGLPERRLLELLRNGPQSMSSLSTALGDEFSVALGKARKNGWIKIGLDQAVESPADAAQEKEPEEILLSKIASSGQIYSDQLSAEEKQVLQNLARRQKGIITEEVQKDLDVRLSERGANYALNPKSDEIGEITPAVIKSGEWKQKHLREIDVGAPSPNYYGGRKHPMRLFAEEVREAFVSLGFTEIQGPIVQSAFWNFDALFIPQHHSAREMQDTFYVSGIRANLLNKNQVESVKASHEKGKGTGSLGWGPGWEIEEARKAVLRTHTTAITIRYLADNRPDEARVFSVDSVFRNEKPNYKSNPQFYQIEGVMTAPGLNLRNLIFVISKFYMKLGFTKVKFWPTYFPYTEPSLQTMVYREDKKRWLELGGMGIFRPEVTVPLGIINPVLAWGLGMDRLVMMKYGIEDIRDLFGANLGFLRRSSIF